VRGRVQVDSVSGRIQSIDKLRGIVIVLMMLDHVRDFIHASSYAIDPLDPRQTNVLLYVTRWVSHFCAPTFVFLAGVSAWLQLARSNDKRGVAWLLLTRGVWLIFLENTVIGFGWSFSLHFSFFLQVIWAIGAAMIVLAGLMWLPRAAVLGIGVGITVGHDLLSRISPDQLGAFADIWKLLNFDSIIQIDGVDVVVVYPALAWLGVMCLGYGIGSLFVSDERRRERLFTALGSFLLVVFFTLRGFNLYGDPHLWQPQGTLRDTLMVFFNVEKYPPSLLFLCITLGPMLLALPLINRWRGVTARVFLTFGSVPFFAYVLHLYIAHILALLLTILCGASTAALIDVLNRANFHPEMLKGTGLPLYVVYPLWLTVLMIVYPLCRWYADLRRRRRDWWLRYL